ncbi:M48 family metalloprotease [Aureimonas jatrophae]|uniref:Putative Zn-dependent protease n=1 Tax=Aureimonas jatrophae TaxID=1166073 RepID=A0A1H0HJV7_9HYPH|nr:M48 family metalloprotease [Aureimonas jatrophae]MBB3950628.1 putative Zn-dependent protease [Aureimonas jatrophae]SDO19468.1 Putative Zn-dependent protease [Aureimonas jatrophae]
MVERLGAGLGAAGRRWGVIALTLAALSGCTSLGSGLEEAGGELQTGYLPGQSRTPVSFEGVQENDPQSPIGRSQHPKILAAYGGAYSDPKLELMLAGIVGKLGAVSDDPGRAYRITVLNSPNINAFALPGGYLYVTRGLLALANDSAEVAAVLAHEMGHVKANHGIERQQREEAAELAGRVVHEVLASDTAARAALARGRLNLASFSRNQELQADAMGIKQTGDAGYDAYAAARFLRTMDQFSSFRNAFQASNPDLDFLASHPAAPQRVELAKKHASAFGPEGSGATDRDRYLSGIDGMLFGDTASEGYVRGRAFFHPGLGITFQVPEGFVIDNTAEAVLATGPGDTAVRFDGIAIPQTTTLTDYIQSGWVGGLDRTSIRPFRIGELEAVSAQAAGGSYVFNVTVVRVGGQVYRFLTALPADSAERLPPIAQSIASSFRLLGPAEREQLKPLRVRIVTARPGDTEASLASRIQGVERKVEMFRLLNDMDDLGPVKAGTRYKIIAE